MANAWFQLPIDEKQQLLCIMSAAVGANSTSAILAFPICRYSRLDDAGGHFD